MQPANRIVSSEAEELILVDADGVVLFFKDGALSDAEREQLISRVISESGHR